MSDSARSPGAERALLPLLLLFFVSGATGLVYEVLWMRRLTLVFGATQLAIATVLAAFMAGLAIGAAAGGRLSDRRSDLLTLYGLLELVIGAYALVFPWLVEWTTLLYADLVEAESVHFWSSQIFHLGTMGLLLLLPTAAMGATLPLLVRWVSGRMSRVATRAGLLYGFNTVGAVVGTWSAGFVLLPLLGVRNSELLAAVANIAVGLFALLWARLAAKRLDKGAPVPVEDDRSDRREEAELLDLVPDPDLEGPAAARLPRVVLATLALSGACTMVYEVAWSRFLALILGSSVYAFTLMLVAFLVGTAGGALAGAARVGKPGVRPMRWLVFAMTAAGLSAFGTNHLFRFMPFWYVDLYAAIDGDDHLLFAAQGLLAALVMTPTTLCIGLAFPFAARIVAGRAESVGEDVSRLYVLNTGGAVVGSLLAGFVLMPRLGIQETLLCAIVVNLGLAAVLLGVRVLAPARKFAGMAVLALGVLGVLSVRPPWDPLLMSAGMYKYVSELSDYSHEAVRNYALSDFELLYYAEGTTSVVTVARGVGSGNIWLANNGKVDASSQEDLRTQVLLGHLPFAHNPRAKSALVVGLASGITAGSVTVQEDLERIDILEIEPAVIVASHYFDQFNHRPLEDPRVRVIANDARNHLVLFDGTYDVIINEPSNPWISGVSNLFTEEFLLLGRSRLSSDGVFCQWLQIYGMSGDDLRSLLRTFTGVFPNVLMYRAVDDSDVLLLGSRAHLDLASFDVGSYFQGARAADLERIQIEDGYDLMTYQRADREGLLSIAADAVVNTDDNVQIEFSAPLFLHYSTADSNSELLEEASAGAWELNRERIPDETAPSFLAGLGKAYERRGLPYDAAQMYLQALARRPGNPELLESLGRTYEQLED